MNLFLKWKARTGPVKEYPQAVAEWYLKTRQQQPNLNIYAIITQAIRVNKHTWSFTPEQAFRLSRHLRSIASSEPDPSDYHLLLRFCSELPYIEANIGREETPQDTRNLFHNVVLEGLNKGLGSFIYKAKSLYTTKSGEGLECHPASNKKKKQNLFSSVAKQDDGLGVKEEHATGFLHDNIQAEEILIARISNGDSEQIETTAEDLSEDESDLTEDLVGPLDGNSPLFPDLENIARYLDELYPPLNENEFSVRNLDLPKNHVLFIFCFNGIIRSQAVSFSEDTTKLGFHIADPQEIIDICLTEQANDKTYFHLCLSLLNDNYYCDDIRNRIEKGLAPAVFVIAKGNDRMVRMITLGRAQSSNTRISL